LKPIPEHLQESQICFLCLLFFFPFFLNAQIFNTWNVWVQAQVPNRIPTWSPFLFIFCVYVGVVELLLAPKVVHIWAWARILIFCFVFVYKFHWATLGTKSSSLNQKNPNLSSSSSFFFAKIAELFLTSRVV
jgi:hypothetical protein